MFMRIRNLVLGLLAGIALVGCGGSGGTNVAEGGIGGTGISTGSVTGFGSIIVNGVHFDTTGAVVMLDEDTPVTNINDADINQLISIGMTVTVKGEINDDGTGTADTILYDDILEGPVVSILSATSVNVLGQTVNVVDGTTRYACDDDYVGVCSFTSFADLADNQVVEISGFFDANGDITAGYIERQEDDYDIGLDQFEIKGIASVVDSSTFTIGGLTVITADTTGLDNQVVEAKGTFDGTDTLTASEVEIEDEGFDIQDADKAELEGIAQTGCTTTNCDFTLTGVTVRVDSNTQYNAGSASDIDPGDKLEAEGSLQGGILFADEIEFK